MADMERVLVVDDDPLMRRQMMRLLKGEFFVSLARNGTEALSLLRAESFSAVVSDVHMPWLDGPGLVSMAMRENLVRKGSIFFVCGDSGAGEVAVLREAGFHVMRKPFQTEAFLQAVRAAVSAGIGSAQTVRA